MATRNKYNKQIQLLGFITWKSINYTSWRTKIFEGGYYDMTQGWPYMGLKVHDITTIGSYVGLHGNKCICTYNVNVYVIVVVPYEGT